MTIGSATVSGQIIGSAGYLEGFVELGTFDGICKYHSTDCGATRSCLTASYC